MRGVTEAGIAVAGDGEFPTLERGVEAEVDAGERGVGAGGLEVVEQAGVEQLQQRGGLRRGEAGDGHEAQAQRDLRALELGVGRPVEAQARLVDQRDGPFRQHAGGAGQKGVRPRQAERVLAVRSEEGLVTRARVFGVRVLDLVDAFGAVSRHALGHHGDEQVIRREGVEQPAVGGLIGRAPDVARALSDLERVEAGLVGELGGEGGAFAAVAEALVELGDACAVPVEIGREGGGAQVAQVGEDAERDLLPGLEAGRREVSPDHQRTVVGGAFPDEGGEAVDEAVALEGLDEAAGARVADQLGEEFIGFAEKIRAGRGHHELELEAADLLDGLDLHHAEGGLAGEEGGFAARRRDGSAGDVGEERPGVALEFVKGGLAADGEGHPVGGVRGLVKGADLGGGGAGEGVLVAGGELALAAAGGVDLAEDGEEAAAVVLHVAHRLVVHGVDLAAGELSGEERRDEELGEAVEALGERLVADLKLVVRVVAGGVGVAVAPVRLHEVAVGVRLRVLRGAEEQHVLEEVRHPLARRRVVDLAHGHHQRGARLVELRVRDQEDLQAVGQDEAAELRLVRGGPQPRRQLGEGRRGGAGQGQGGQQDQDGGEQAAADVHRVPTVRCRARLPSRMASFPWPSAAARP